ncbi:hypothetical protein GQ607_008544 [Colletotrichum asianum]|uniref:GPI anchored protein n=1 Tax=Colletotrichum asianum TaxID=702518 RepID=A0A8H3ZLC8_9PEZI|nr:hypothetical protein GQ607_008544 [Colletotrichum asianum]
MKTSQILAILGFSAFAMAQSSSYTLAPSPTESYGCEPHINHWHCEGARATTGAAEGTTLSTAVAATTTATEDHDDDDHDHSGTGVLPPSPTESAECVAHSDHWHCEGPASTAAAGNATVTTTTAATTGTDAAATSASGAAATSTDVPAGAARVGFGAAAIAAALMAF